MINLDKVALNPLQYVATADGWIDPTLAPPLGEQLAFIAEQGFRFLHCAVPDTMSPSEYRKTLAEHGIAAGPGYVSLRLGDDAGNVERARTVAAANAEAGSEVTFLAMSMGLDAPRVQHAAIGFDFDDARFEQVIELIGSAAEAMVAEGVTPALHPHVGTWIETESETRRVLAAVPESILKFGPDTGHLTWAGADVPALLADFAPRTAGIHIKDLFVDVARDSRDQRLDYKSTIQRVLWTEPGTGDADFEAIYAALDGFDGWTVIEVDKGRLEPPEASISECGAWLRSQDR